MPNPKYTDQFKLQMITEFMKSNKTMKTFCDERCINFNSFKIWFYDYKKQREKWQAIEQKTLDPAEVIMYAEKELTVEDKEGLFASRILIMKIRDASISFDKSCLKEVLEAVRGYD